MVKTNKKAISPVVATALLLVVAVVAVVGFQTWFNTYQSGLNTQVEQQSQTGTAVTIERLETDGTNCTVYLKSGSTETITVKEVKVGSGTNNTPTNISKGITTFAVPSCSVEDDASADVVVLTDNGIFQETEIAR